MERCDAEPAREDEHEDERIERRDCREPPTPTAERIVPPGISQSAPRRSDQRPKSGWTSEDDTVDASRSIAANA